jgi:hypothetical protein
LNLEGESKVSKRWKVGETFTTDYGVELTLGPDIDLEKEEFILSDGQRLTNELVGEIANCDCLRSSNTQFKNQAKVESSS